jgi:hypothetical protein
MQRLAVSPIRTQISSSSSAVSPIVRTQIPPRPRPPLAVSPIVLHSDRLHGRSSSSHVEQQ